MRWYLFDEYMKYYREYILPMWVDVLRGRRFYRILMLFRNAWISTLFYIWVRFLGGALVIMMLDIFLSMVVFFLRELVNDLRGGCQDV